VALVSASLSPPGDTVPEQREGVFIGGWYRNEAEPDKGRLAGRGDADETARHR